MTILFITGINDNSMIGVTLNESNMPAYVYDGNCSLHGRLPLRKGVDAYAFIFGMGVQQRKFAFSEAPSLIINQIADADTHRGSLKRCIELCAQVNSPVINRPQHILQTTRDLVSETLQGIPGVIMPRTVRFNPRSPEDVFARAEAEHFGWPFIVRLAGLHGGKSMIRVTGPEDYSSLHIFPFDGRDFYLTQYVDSRNTEGFYQRQRLIVIDGKAVLRGALYDEDWKVHGASRSFMLGRENWEVDRERSRLFESEVIPRLGPAIAEITRRLKLELYGIDCNMHTDGTMLIFEANANMNILTNDHPQMNDRMSMIRDHILAMLTRHSGERLN
jgi:glutathione synthase/RimK-type ligase-like ATP-grasp enzyme